MLPRGMPPQTKPSRPPGLGRGEARSVGAGEHTHAFLLTFDNAADRDAYLPHPAHKEFVEILKPILDKATVVDFVAKAAP